MKMRAGQKRKRTSWRYLLLPRSLFARSLLIIAVPLLLLQIIVAVTFFDRHWDSTSSRLVYAVSGEIEFIVRQLQEAKTAEERDHIAREASRSLGLSITFDETRTALSQRGGDPFARHAWFSVGRKLQEHLEKKLDVPFVMRPYEREKWFIIEVEYKPQTFLTILSHERRLVSSTTYIFLLWLIGSAAVLCLVAVVFMRNQIRPILRLAIAAENFGKGQDVPGFRPTGATEIRKASHAFLQMRDRLKRQMEQRAMMLAGVSHDLRTPLTRMKLQVALQPPTPESQSLQHDIDEMDRMLTAYLAFARGEGEEPISTVMLQDMLDSLAVKARREGFEVSVVCTPLGKSRRTAPGRVQIRTRPLALERALGNIIGNACRYAGRVSIRAQERRDDIVIVVEDDGPGIPPDRREDVFKPFYRLETSRNPKTGGTGLGLSIAQDIVHAHGGQIVLGDSAALGGLAVTITLPK